MAIVQLQEQLESLYGVQCGLDVRDFLISNPEIVEFVEPAAEGRDVQEKLLVLQDGEDVDLALYIDAEVLEHLEARDPSTGVDRDNLAEYWIALEGVSHFIYFVVNALRGSSVTLLELEMQAEVDKYVSTCLSMATEGPRADRVHEILFEETVFHEDLDESDLERYRDASRFAGKYCHRLKPLLDDGRVEELMADIRYFYRLGQSAKIRYIG